MGKVLRVVRAVGSLLLIPRLLSLMSGLQQLSVKALRLHLPAVLLLCPYSCSLAAALTSSRHSSSLPFSFSSRPPLPPLPPVETSTTLVGLLVLAAAPSSALLSTKM